MVITEVELRQAWQNGRGQIPTFPPGTRFTPAALDFLKVRQPSLLQSCASPTPLAPSGPRRVLQAPKGQRLIFTAVDVPELLAGAGTTLVVHPSVTVTHAALELLRKAGAEVFYNDPFFPTVGRGRHYDLNMTCTPLENLGQYDAVLIITDHTSYDYAHIVAESKIVIDTRNATKGITAPNIVHC